MTKPSYSRKEVKNLINNQLSRVEVTKRNHLWFFHTYLSRHVEYPIADFQKEMFGITENDDIKFAAITSFRESGKSTLMTLSFPIWAILGRMQCKFVVIISQTQEQARQHFGNLRRELETNELLKQDLGPFERLNEWNNCSLVIKKYNSKIIAVSREQSFRGLKYGEHRPDLIIADDVENSDSVRTQEARDLTYKWFTSEVMPLGSRKTKVIVVGNLLHEDSLLKRLDNSIREGTRSGIFRRYPLLDENGNSNWPGKFPDAKSIEEEKMKIGDIYTWYREYLLLIVDEREPVIRREWFHYFPGVPIPAENETVSYAIGIDPALSEKDGADFTAMVACMILGTGKNKKYYILPNVVNEHLDWKQILDTISMMVKGFGGKYATTVYIEEAMLQGWLTKELKLDNFEAVGVKTHGRDKRMRLSMTSNRIQLGTILFCTPGTEKLQNQMLTLGVGHDDMVDAFSTLIQGIVDRESEQETVEMINCINMYRRII